MKIALTIPGTNGTPIRIDSGLPVPTGGLNTAGNNILSVGVEIVLIGAILLCLYFIIRGGLNIITSGGDKEKFQKGRERVRYAIIGLIIIFLSFFLINILGTLFGVNLIGKQPAP